VFAFKGSNPFLYRLSRYASPLFWRILAWRIVCFECINVEEIGKLRVWLRRYYVLQRGRRVSVAPLA
jgi:hypothetical protein